MDPITALSSIPTLSFPRHQQVIQAALGLAQNPTVVDTALNKERGFSLDVDIE
jgi:hypothetical protein